MAYHRKSAAQVFFYHPDILVISLRVRTKKFFLLLGVLKMSERAT